MGMEKITGALPAPKVKPFKTTISREETSPLPSTEKASKLSTDALTLGTKSPELIEFENKLSELPQELQDAYNSGGVEGYNKAVDKYNAKVEQLKREYEVQRAAYQAELEKQILRSKEFKLTPEEEAQIKEYEDTLAFANKVRSGEVKLEDWELKEFWDSVERVKEKYEILRNAIDVKKSYFAYDQKIPEETQKQLDIIEKLTVGKLSGIYDPISGAIDVKTALIGGVSENDLKLIGISDTNINQAKAQIELLTKYQNNWFKAIEEGDVSLVRKVYGNEATLDLQINVADTRSREIALSKIPQNIIQSIVKPDGTTELTVNLEDAIDMGISASTLRQAGFNISNEEYDSIKKQKEKAEKDIPVFDDEWITPLSTENKQALSQLNSYKSGEGYNLAAILLSRKFTARQLEELGFKTKDIKETQDIVNKFNKLSRFNQIAYIGNGVGINARNRASKEKNPVDALTPNELMKLINYYYTIQNIDLSEFARQQWQNTGKAWLSLVPIAGTALLWKELESWERGLSIAGDVLLFASVMKLPKILSYAKRLFKAEGLVQLEDILKLNRGSTLSALKKIAPPDVVGSYKAMLKAIDEYAENQAIIRSLRKLINKIGGEGMRRDLDVALETAENNSSKLQSNVIKAGDNFASKIKTSSPKGKSSLLEYYRKMGIDNPELFKDYGKNLRYDIDAAVERIYSSYVNKTFNIAKLQRRAKALNSDLKIAIHDKSIAEISRLQKELDIVRLRTEALQLDRIASGQVTRQTLQATLDDLMLKYMRGGAKDKSLLKKILVLQKQLDEYNKTIMKGLSRQEVIWAEDIPRGTGRQSGIGLSTRPSRVGPQPRILGSLISKGQAPYSVLSPVRIMTTSIPTVTGPMRITKIIPAEQPVPIILDPEEPEAIPVSPQPIWTDILTSEVEAPEKEPEVIPETVPEPMPEEAPNITWSPNVVYVPLPETEITTVLQEWIEPFIQRTTSTKAIRQIITSAAQLIRLNATRAQFNKTMNQIFPLVSSQTTTQTQPDTLTSQLTSTDTATDTKLVTSTKVIAKPVTKVAGQTKVSQLITTYLKPITPLKVPVSKVKLTPAHPVSSNDIKEPEKKKITDGSIAWKQGIFWYYIPPPWNQQKPIPLRSAPRGAKESGRTPEQTIQMIGKPKSKVPKTASIDLGIVDIIIEDYGKKIRFLGLGEKTNVSGSLSKTTGMSVPAKTAHIIKHKKRRETDFLGQAEDFDKQVAVIRN